MTVSIWLLLCARTVLVAKDIGHILGCVELKKELSKISDNSPGMGLLMIIDIISFSAFFIIKGNSSLRGITSYRSDSFPSLSTFL